ncbi:MAG: DNA polymerase III subunit delta' [Aerococcus sp.]|nr:DNA polymerase III subunit delta' [Aerococcus sp.]
MASGFKIEDKQPQLAQAMRTVGGNQRISRAYLFEGQAGVGQEELATFMAAMIFCVGDTPKPCGVCSHCQRIKNQDYGDVIWIEPDEGSLKIDQMRAVKQDLSLSAIESESKVFVLTQSERMTTAAANSLLKFLEEPNENVYLFLLTTQRDNILPTIRSRCQVVHFPSLNRQQVIAALEQAGLTLERAQLMSALTSDLTRAEALNQDDIFKHQVNSAWGWLSLILKRDIRSFTMVASEWIPLTKDREANQRLLELVLLYGADLLKLKQNPDATDLMQPTKRSDYLAVLNLVSLEALLEIVSLIARVEAMIEHRVTVQAALEYFVLTSWDLLKSLPL